MKKILITTLSIVAILSLVSCKANTTTSNANNMIDNITQNITNTQQNYISIEKAKEIALKNSNLTSDQASFIKANQEFDDGIKKYDIEFYSNNKKYDYEINAINGDIISYDIENFSVISSSINTQQNYISIEKAKEIALKNSNLTSDQVSFIKANQEFDDGIKKYDIEFYSNNKEYDCEINAINGDIISYDYDMENFSVISSSINTQQNYISIEKAKEIALKNSNLTSDQVSFIKANQEFDDGIKKYDIEFYSNNKEYDCKINAINGDVISYDYECYDYE